MSDLQGLKIKVEPTGRGEVNEPVSEWPIVEGFELVDAELTADALSAKRAVRVQVGDVLQPAINLDGSKAAIIYSADSTIDKGMQFSRNGAEKPSDASFYASQWAKRKSATLASDPMEGR